MVIMRSALLSVTSSGLLTDVSTYHAKMRMSRMVGKQTNAAVPSDAIMSNITTTTQNMITFNEYATREVLIYI
jgi:hypothetical protein